MFMQIAIGAIAIGVVLFIAFLVLAQVKDLMPSEAALNGTNFTQGMDQTQATVIAGFGLIGVGVVVIAAWGIVALWK